MPVKKLTEQIYNDLAASREMEWIGKEIPANGETATDWFCLRCGRHHHKSYRAVKNRKKACRCHNAQHVLQPDAYEALAAKYGLEWLRGEYLPHTSKHPQMWRVVATGVVFEASYNEIDVKMHNKVKAALGLPYRARGGDFTKVRETADV